MPLAAALRRFCKPTLAEVDALLEACPLLSVVRADFHIRPLSRQRIVGNRMCAKASLSS